MFQSVSSFLLLFVSSSLCFFLLWLNLNHLLLMLDKRKVSMVCHILVGLLACAESRSSPGTKWLGSRLRSGLSRNATGSSLSSQTSCFCHSKRLLMWDDWKRASFRFYKPNHQLLKEIYWWWHWSITAALIRRFDFIKEATQTLSITSLPLSLLISIISAVRVINKLSMCYQYVTNMLSICYQ